MASINKRQGPRGRTVWQARIVRKGYPRQFRTFDTKATAESWARQVESEIDQGSFISRSEAESTTIAQALERFKEERISNLRGGDLESGRISRLNKHLGEYTLATLTSVIVAQYRDSRLKEGASAQTVIHELGLLGRLFGQCNEWGITLPRGNPVQGVKRPRKPQGRNRRLESEEEKWLLSAAEDYGGVIGPIIRFALETAMRRSEIASMDWKHLDRVKRVLKIPHEPDTPNQTKNEQSREIPLSSTALSILDGLPTPKVGSVWNTRADSITQAFIRVRDRAHSAYIAHCRQNNSQPRHGFLQDMKFHDLRHEATSRLAKLVPNVIELASITGHTDLKMLQRYYHTRAEELAKKLT